MHLDVTATNLDASGVSVQLNQAPDTCPRCHRSVHPKFVSAHIKSDGSDCQGVFRCTHLKCQEIFIGSYEFGGGPSGRRAYRLVRVAPQATRKSAFPETIQEISPSFCEIFNQAEDADSNQLDQLVGIGLRKALEFLVKDYAAAEHPDQEQKIRSSQLAKCIATYVTDTNVKECATRAAWLGNDETHYTRKWESKDVSDLRLLVRLTVNWIDNSLLTKKYVSEMSRDGA